MPTIVTATTIAPTTIAPTTPVLGLVGASGGREGGSGDKLANRAGGLRADGGTMSRVGTDVVDTADAKVW